MKNNNEIKDSKKAKCVRLIAEMLDGLQVPLSVKGVAPLFGTALAPYMDLLQLLSVDGFEDQTGFIKRLERVIN